MKAIVGTFNLNNLFSRFNFSGAIDEIQTGGKLAASSFTGSSRTPAISEL